MVMRFGMSEKLGPRVFGHDTASRSSGREFSAEPDYSTRSRARSTTRSAASSRPRTRSPRTSLSEHREHLETISQLLLKRETIEREEFEALLAGKGEEEIFGSPEIGPRHARAPGAPGAARARAPRGPARAAAGPGSPAGPPRPAVYRYPTKPDLA
jgi:cell division protease FtsH